VTLLIGSVFGDCVADLEPLAGQAWAAGVDALEIRIDTFRETLSALNEFLRKHENRTWLVTCRSQREGGYFAGDPADTVHRVLQAAEGTGAWVDVELAVWRGKRQLQADLRRHLDRDPRVRIVLSSHTDGPPPQPLSGLIEEVLQTHPQSIAKIAFDARHIADSFPAIDATHRFGDRVIAIAMGESGAWTRLLAKKLGAFATFASIDQPTAPGQWGIDELGHTFGWDRINRETKIFGVVGDPVAHSLSPQLFNHWFRVHGINAMYVPLRVESDRGGLAGFLADCKRRPWLGLAGLSVTIPHKESALHWAGPNADPMSREIGAANTLILEGTSHTAYNTDCYAAVDSLGAALGRTRSELNGLTVDVLGAGGSARAVCYGLSEMGCRINVFARTPSHTDDFGRWGVSVHDWAERTSSTSEIVINCTPIGMWPHTVESPMPPDSLHHRRLVYDLIYRPLESRLLADAREAGVATLGGLDMFVRQAATQFALWTGVNADTAAARDLLETRMQAMQQKRSVALIGARGSGKSSVGKLLAKLLDMPHVDTDDMVVASTGRTIREIFEQEGEAGFRDLESHAVRSVLAMAPAVISLGGGALLDPQNVSTIRNAALIVGLTAPADVLVERVLRDPHSAYQRPPLTSSPSSTEMEEILKAREPLYRAAADFIVDTAELEPADVAQQVLYWYLHRDDAETVFAKGLSRRSRPNGGK